ncbi:hypothetical protein DRN69_08835 [Candidatus Pacearchaeota archaeon]|nr:MAG: hypothetical protein DRN69_08835 [Candidatus Pacearchaeota archaeon]
MKKIELEVEEKNFLTKEEREILLEKYKKMGLKGEIVEERLKEILDYLKLNHFEVNRNVYK